jgi:hypothetical protein
MGLSIHQTRRVAFPNSGGGEYTLIDRRQPVGRREAIIAGCGVMASLLVACSSTSASNDTAVDLKYTKNGRLTGTFAGRPFDVTSKLPSGSGMAGGTVTGDPFDANWQISYDGTSSQTVLPVRLHGTLARQSLSLSAVFRLRPNFLFDSGTVTGTAGGRPVHALASPAAGESSSSVNVVGSFAGIPFSLYATLAGDLVSGLIRGTVGGKPMHINAKVQSGAIHITGNYTGPSELFAVATGSIIYFLGGTYSA